MSINQFRGSLYAAAKMLGDVQAFLKAFRTGSPKPIVKRVLRRQAGRVTARGLGSMFRW